jgi:hypothetical protein
MKKSIVMLALLLFAQLCGYAVDGQVLINQATLNAAGGTYTITSPGSYKLSGNLQQKDKDTNVIVIASDNVMIDLNGFSITGPVDCSAGFPCTNRGFGLGIVAASPDRSNITIRNGTIQGVGNFAILLKGNAILIEYMNLRGNGSDGIYVSRNTSGNSHAILRNNIVEMNNGDGIFTDSGQVTDNVIDGNGGDGIVVWCVWAPILPINTVARNTVSRNSLLGLSLAGSASYIGNTLAGNNAGGAQVQGGYNLGQNLCGGAACP